MTVNENVVWYCGRNVLEGGGYNYDHGTLI